MSIANKLAEERRARLAAERLLELKQAELFAANRKLGRRAKALSDEIVETRAEITTVRDENQRVKSDLTVAHQKIELVEQRLWHSIETIHDGFAMFDIDNGMVMANRAYLSVFDGLEEIGPGVSYARILPLLTEEGIVNVGQHTAAEWRATMTQRWQSRDPSPVVIRLWNDEYIRLIDRRGHGGDVVSLALNITDTVKYEKAIKVKCVKIKKPALWPVFIIPSSNPKRISPMRKSYCLRGCCLRTVLQTLAKVLFDDLSDLRVFPPPIR